MPINTKLALKAALNAKVQSAIEKLTNAVYKKLLYFIQVDIYDTYDTVQYNRTGEFKEVAWDKYCFKTASEIVGRIDYNWQAMTYNPDAYQHGSYVGGDRRAQLAEILNRGIEDWDGWDFGRSGGAEYPRPFFTDTLNWLDENLEKEVKKAFDSVGLKISKKNI